MHQRSSGRSTGRGAGRGTGGHSLPLCAEKAGARWTLASPGGCTRSSWVLSRPLACGAAGALGGARLKLIGVGCSIVLRATSLPSALSTLGSTPRRTMRVPEGRSWSVSARGSQNGMAI